MVATFPAATRVIGMRSLKSIVLVALCVLLLGASPRDDLERARIAADVPALGVAVFSDGQQRVFVAGSRPDNDAGEIERDDAFHIGSCTKAMTATLAAKYVEEGKLNWTTTLAEAVPAVADDAGPLGDATLKQLLSHTAGLRGGQAEVAVLPKLWALHE
ncbi:MAG: serine hydrolase domain-containing protein, partial [Planctomycetota bacterium]